MEESDVLILSENQEGLRLDKLLATYYPSYSRSYFQELIETGNVLVNGKILKKREKPKTGDEIEVLFVIRPGIDLTPEPIPLDVLYEDEHLLAINKPIGMVVHPAPGHPNHTFVNALLYHCAISHQHALRPGIVHRLDKDTSGVLLAAKTEEAHRELVQLFAQRSIQKKYIAITEGEIADGCIDAPIGRHPKDRKKMAVLEEKGKEAKTICKTLSFSAPFSLLEITLITGRTHQIRVHLSYKKTPILGDPIYGHSENHKNSIAKRLFLHAHTLSFIHPISKIPLHFSAPIPQEFFLNPLFSETLKSLLR